MNIDLRSYDWIVINTSAGKDSQTMLDVVYRLAVAAGVANRLVAVHCDLGRVEWEGTLALAREQAEHYGIWFEVVSRIGKTTKKSGKKYKAGEVQGDLLDYAERHGKWPDSQNRWCTSDFKRGPVSTLHTKLARRWAARVAPAQPSRPCRILNCMGMRAEESPKRKKMPVFERDEAISNGRKVVDDWLPIHTVSTAAIWEGLPTLPTRSHPAYAKGMKRLSCAFCIFAPVEALMIAGEHNPALLADYVRVEEKIGHAFQWRQEKGEPQRKQVFLRVIQDRLQSGERVTPDVARDAGDWNM